MLKKTVEFTQKVSPTVRKLESINGPLPPPIKPVLTDAFRSMLHSCGPLKDDLANVY